MNRIRHLFLKLQRVDRTPTISLLCQQFQKVIDDGQEVIIINNFVNNLMKILLRTNLKMKSGTQDDTRRLIEERKKALEEKVRKQNEAKL